VAAVTSSFDPNLFPASDLLRFGNKKMSQGLNPENTVDGAAIRSAIRLIWPWRLRRSPGYGCFTVWANAAPIAPTAFIQKQESSHRPILRILPTDTRAIITKLMKRI